MINIPEELKTLYKTDVIPIVTEISHKELTLYFPEIDLTITNDKIVSESFSLTESLCSTEDLTLGSCEGAQLKITVANLVQDLSGHTVVVTQTVNDTYTMPLGTYTVKSCQKQNDLWFREIIAYDDMTKTNTDVTAWYNSLTWPQTVKSMRESLLTYLGIEYEDQTITNDSVQLVKTVEPASLIGRDVLRRLCEINGGFGHITREGKFKVIQLTGLGLYPSETLYPAEDLFPSEPGETLTAGYKHIDYEEYIVEPITQLQISQEDGDVGVTVGTEGNLYKISENFLLYGKNSTELTDIANNILLVIKNKYYRPHNTVCIGLPYIEVGDALTIITQNDAIETFVFTRTLKGIQALEDEFSATGNQKMVNRVSPQTEIQQLKGRTLKLKKTLDEVSSVITDLEQQTETAITQLSDSISLKVDKNGVISAINLSSETAKIQAPNIQFEGIVTANGRFKILADGSMEAVNGKFSGTISSSNIQSPNITGGNIVGALFRSNDDPQDPDEAYMTLDSARLRFFADGGVKFLDISHSGIVGVNPSSYGGEGRPLRIYPVSSSIEVGYIYADYINVKGHKVLTENSSINASNVGPGGSLGLFNISQGGGYISYGGNFKDSGYSYIGMNTIQATNIQNLSHRDFKDNIKLYKKSALNLICNTPIYNFTYKDDEEGENKVHVGVITDEAPEDILASEGKSVSLYDMISVTWKAIQEIKKEIENIKKYIY